MKIKAVIFDLDGTLVNSIDDLADSMNYILHDNGLPEHDINCYYGFVGRGLRQLVIESLPENKRDDAFVDVLYEEMKTLYQQNITNKTEPYSGIVQLLRELKESGILISVLSNKADELTKKVVNEVFSNISFENVVGFINEEKGKPNPDVAKEIASEMGVNPDECIFVGDTSIDMKTAKNAGMTGVGVSWGFREIEELNRAGADLIINKPSELLEIIKKRG